jgi:predicted nucleotidyltransferase
VNVLLSGIVGSTAYGLKHAGSDIDILGMFAAPTVELHGLAAPKGSIVTTAPDSTFHEAAKAVRLILTCNPTASELLWLDRYEATTALGEELIGMRGSLLSEIGVRRSYLGYSTQQLRKIKSHGPESRMRQAKHARHLVRLVHMAEELHTTGQLTIRLADPDKVRRLGEEIAERPEAGDRLIARAEEALDRPGVLPAEPDAAAAEAWLRRVRKAYWAEVGA